MNAYNDSRDVLGDMTAPAEVLVAVGIHKPGGADDPRPVLLPLDDSRGSKSALA